MNRGRVNPPEPEEEPVSVRQDAQDQVEKNKKAKDQMEAETNVAVMGTQQSRGSQDGSGVVRVPQERPGSHRDEREPAAGGTLSGGQQGQEPAHRKDKCNGK